MTFILFGLEGVNIGQEIEKVAKNLNLSSGSTQCIYIEETRCLDEVQFEELSEIIDQTLRRKLESGLIDLSVYFVSDSASSHVVNDTILNFHDYFCGFDLHSLHIRTQPIQGLNCLNAILQLENSLGLCDSVMFRDITDAQLFFEKNSQSQFSRSDLTHYFACDLISLLSHTNSTPYLELWPCNVCSQNKKLFDVRSSLWKYFKYQTAHSVKTKTRPFAEYADEPFDSLKALSLNLSCGFSNRKLPRSTVIPFSLVSMAVHKHELVRSYDSTTDAQFVVNAATGARKYTWLDVDHMRSKNQNDRISHQSLGTLSHNTLNPQSGRIAFNAISYASPFSVETILEICHRAEEILDRGAFTHHLRYGAPGVLEVRDAIASLHLTLG
jgi:hypothetical protein